MRSLIAALSLALFLAIPSTAEARYHKHSGAHHRHHARSAHHVHRVRHARYSDGRPSAWCGWWMRQHTGIKDPSLNLARNWAKVGHALSGPVENAIGVMAHHVFQVVAVVGPGRVLAISGNDGQAVRTRVRSTRGVIAWRHV